MTITFKSFRDKLFHNFIEQTKNVDRLFAFDVDKDELWNLYLDSFPEGTNEIFRVRREYDCSCCRSFIRSVGNIAIINNGTVKTIWDFTLNDDKYSVVCKALNDYLLGKQIQNVFYAKESKYGTKFNVEYDSDNGVTYEFEHFYIEMPDKFQLRKNQYATYGEIIGRARDSKNVLVRSLDEITMDALETILELIKTDTLYRGYEWKRVLTEFVNIKKSYDELSTEREKELFAWETSTKVGETVSKLRNHSIGVLLVDVSNGVDLETAVKKYENIVAPSNYKRPKAIFTQKMLDDAKQKLIELGYMDSLKRRYANIDDMNVRDVLFIKRESSVNVDDDLFADLSKETKSTPKKFGKLQEVSVDKFVNDILPDAESVELYLENRHTPNFVSLIAPAIKDAKSMFKWDNGFTWSYNGNVADSDITTRVKESGGRIDGVLRFSQSWNYDGMRNASLMDTHVFMPNSNQNEVMAYGKEIHDNYGNCERVGWNNRNHYNSGGMQDVDYVKPAPVGYIPVENITFPDMSRLPDGIYKFKIHNWHFRSPTSGGFKAELAFGGNIYHFTHKEALKNKEWVTLAILKKTGSHFEIVSMAQTDDDAVSMWGVKTNKFVSVKMACFSPNYWGENNVGNKHLFMMLDDCNNDNANGFYNEFLKAELIPHKRVFEALSSKTKPCNTDNQLSGVGFCLTKRNDFIVKVKGRTERVFKVII